MKIDSEVLRVLSGLQIVGDKVRIVEQLARPLYVKTDKVLQACGGRWSRSERAHLFDETDPAIVVAKAIAAGAVETDDDLGFFATPPEVARRVVSAAGITLNSVVLEPSAGDGALVREALRSTGACDYLCFEIDEGRAAVLRKLPPTSKAVLTVETADFLSVAAPSEGEGRYVDFVVMNPPFARQADLDHVRHAFAFLRTGGRLAAVMSAGVSFRTNAKTNAFMDLVRKHKGTIESLPAGSFKTSGTNVNTVLVTMKK